MNTGSSSNRRAQSLPLRYTPEAYDLAGKSFQQAYPFPTDDVIIVLMGPTGAGKSTFIDVATNQAHSAVGHGLESYTRTVCPVRCSHPGRSGRNVVLVDTPGFDDTSMSDSEVLACIARWFAETYSRKTTLSGILFFHRISDNRMAGNPLRNLSMFEKLCGGSALQNVILTTTMWDEVSSEVGSSREQVLLSGYWKPMILCGSRVARFQRTHESAWEIIDTFFNAGHSSGPPGSMDALRIQTEIVDERKVLHETDAGNALLRWWDNLIANLRHMLHALDIRLRGISKESDPEAAAEVEKEREAIAKKLEEATQQKKLLTAWGVFLRFLWDVAGKLRIRTPPLSRSLSPNPRRQRSLKHHKGNFTVLKPDPCQMTRQPDQADFSGNPVILKGIHRAIQPYSAPETSQPASARTTSRTICAEPVSDPCLTIHLRDTKAHKPSQPTVDSKMRLNQVLGVLPHLNLSEEVEQREKDLRVGGGQFDLFYGYSRRHRQHVAIRRLRIHLELGPHAANRLARELLLWSRFDHSNVLPLLGYTINPNGLPSFVVEWMENGHVMGYLSRSNAADLISLVADIASGLAYLHEKDVIHADMKPENVLVTSSGRAVLTDFGLSRLCANHDVVIGNIRTSGTLKGTACYYAIEIVQALFSETCKAYDRPREDDRREDNDSRPQMKYHTKRSDVWAFGMTVYALLANRHPYSDQPDFVVMQDIREGKLPREDNDWDQDRFRLWERCKRCWETDPAQRPTMADLSQEIVSLRAP